MVEEKTKRLINKKPSNSMKNEEENQKMELDFLAPRGTLKKSYNV